MWPALIKSQIYVDCENKRRKDATVGFYLLSAKIKFQNPL